MSSLETFAFAAQERWELTPAQERAILATIVYGYYKIAADKLGCTNKSMEAHAEQVHLKLGTLNMAQSIAKYVARWFGDNQGSSYIDFMRFSVVRIEKLNQQIQTARRSRASKEGQKCRQSTKSSSSVTQAVTRSYVIPVMAKPSVTSASQQVEGGKTKLVTVKKKPSGTELCSTTA